MGSRRNPHCLSIVGGLFALLIVSNAAPATGVQRFDGFNVIVTPGHPYGSASARRALLAARRLGATAVAIVPFLWQASPSAATICRGGDMSDDQLRIAIREAQAAGFVVIIKPHVWVPESWAGAIVPGSERDWQTWFSSYRAALERIAEIAAAENAQAMAIGTELAKTTHRPEWLDIIASVREKFPRMVLYFAHNAEEVERIRFWNKLDAVGATLYPSFGADHDRASRVHAMDGAAMRLDRIAAAEGKPVVIGEIGLRSAVGAAAKPWESAEERRSDADPMLQAEVIADWLAVLHRPAIRGVLIWRWFTDPDAGGVADTDFTVQGKPAEGVLLCAWKVACPRP